MKRYRGFLFDADNTLFDYDCAEREALMKVLGGVAPNVSAETALATYRDINAGYWKRFEEGRMTLPALKSGRFRDLLSALGAHADPDTVSAAYLNALASHARFLPHAREVLEELATRASLCLITNGITEVQRGRIGKAGIAHLFRAIIISEEIGISKPDPRFFQAAARALSLRANDLLCIGDNPSTDIEGAAAAGMDACWYSRCGAPWPGPGPAPKYVISDLRELIDLAPPIPK